MSESQYAKYWNQTNLRVESYLEWHSCLIVTKIPACEKFPWSKAFKKLGLTHVGGPNLPKRNWIYELFNFKTESLQSKPALRKSRKQGIPHLGVLIFYFGTRGGSREPENGYLQAENKKTWLNLRVEIILISVNQAFRFIFFSSEHMIQRFTDLLRICDFLFCFSSEHMISFRIYAVGIDGCFDCVCWRADRQPIVLDTRRARAGYHVHVRSIREYGRHCLQCCSRNHPGRLDFVECARHESKWSTILFYDEIWNISILNLRVENFWSDQKVG